MINLNFHNIYIHSPTKDISMKEDTTREIISIIAIILGVLMLIYPQLVGYLAGLFLIIYGILELIK
jgi:uncharacterized membrane protein HdeD (DUF308 family)